MSDDDPSVIAERERLIESGIVREVDIRFPDGNVETVGVFREEDGSDIHEFDGQPESIREAAAATLASDYLRRRYGLEIRWPEKPLEPLVDVDEDQYAGVDVINYRD